jgi:hypothetical protein
MGLVPASYKVTARSVSRVLGDGRRQSDRSLKGHEADVRKGQPWAVNHHPGIVAVYGLSRPEVHGHALKCLGLDIQARRTRI